MHSPSPRPSSWQESAPAPCSPWGFEPAEDLAQWLPESPACHPCLHWHDMARDMRPGTGRDTADPRRAGTQRDGRRTRKTATEKKPSREEHEEGRGSGGLGDRSNPERKGLVLTLSWRPPIFTAHPRPRALQESRPAVPSLREAERRPAHFLQARMDGRTDGRPGRPQRWEQPGWGAGVTRETRAGEGGHREEGNPGEPQDRALQCPHPTA